jgi:ankyrin repeat protein
LHIACIIGDGKILKALFDKGAIFSTTNGLVNALHLVCGASRLDGLNAFLRANPRLEVNVVDSNGWTALHYLADSGGGVDMLQLLLSKGADPTIKSHKASLNFEAGIRAAKIALARNNLDLAIALDSK